MKKQSPGLKHVQHVWDQVERSSWERLNHALRAALGNAITSGMKFDIGDFKYMAKEMSLSRWGGDVGEWSYSLACGSERLSENPGAVAAIEHYLGRDPFLWADDVKTPSRLHIGSRLKWKGELVTVTSFNDVKKSLVACSYDNLRYRGDEKLKVGDTEYVLGAYREVEAISELPDGSIAVRVSKSLGERPGQKPKRRHTIVAADLNGIRKEYDARRRKHEKAISAAQTLEDLESARKAASDIGADKYRHFDLDILRAALAKREEEIRDNLSDIQEAAHRAAYAKKYAEDLRIRTENHAKNIAMWREGEDVHDFLHEDILLRIKGDFVEVSNGNKVSITTARLTLKFVKKNKDGWKANGQKYDVDAFPLREISKGGVQIGCTLIPWTEVSRLEIMLRAKR